MKEKKKFFTVKYFLLVLASSILLTPVVLFLANDAFAITAEDKEVEISIPEGADDGDIAKILKENGLIKSKLWFRAYLSLRGKELAPFGSSYTVPLGSGFDGIHRILNYGSPKTSVQVRVSIPEGSTVDDIAEIICQKHGICSREEFIDTVRSGDFSKYEFVSALTDEQISKRKYRLEGYLYPDTYCFYSSSSAYAVIDKMLSNFDSKFDSKYRLACKNKGMSIDEAVTLASVVIKEAKYVSDYPKVASVFCNRLKSPAFAKRLQSDATLVYALGREMRSEDKELDSPYNTYRYGGLPPSAIANPDINSLSYAIYPDSTPYYYFVTGKNGKVLYARDYDTHLLNIKRVSEWEQS